jgi:hypothetical protein
MRFFIYATSGKIEQEILDVVPEIYETEDRHNHAIDIDSLEEFLSIAKRINCELVIDAKDRTIEIYDDYRE